MADTSVTSQSASEARLTQVLIGSFALAFALCARHFSSPLFCLDDAYIHLSYVRSLKLGEGLSYNPNDWETGASSPLWVLLLALWPGAVPPTLAVKVLGALLHGASASLMGSLPRACDARAPRSACWASGLLWAATPLAVQAGVSGMEVPLAVALALATSWLALRGRYAASASCAALAYLARPELAIYCAALALGLALLRRSLRPLLLLAGTGVGFALFAGYCLAVSGYPLPNTFYVKGRALDAQSVAYLGLEVLPWQPVVLSGVGLLLAGWALWRARAARGALLCLVASAALALIATACSRTLYPGVLFFQSRYFVPLLWFLPLCAATGLSVLQRVPGALACAALSTASAFLLVRGSELTEAQERGVGKLHVEPALYLAAHAADARTLGVEGAGALRYLTPRSLRVVDLEGLNDARIAHTQGSFFVKLCHLAARGGSHLAYPAQWHTQLNQAFVLEPLKRFTEPAYAQLDPPASWQLTLARIVAPKPEFAKFCASRDSGL